jgi:hypothetical protein
MLIIKKSKIIHINTIVITIDCKFNSINNKYRI